MIDIDFDVYYEIISLFKDVYDNYDKRDEGHFENAYLKCREEKALLLFRVAAPQFLCELETAIDETSDLLRELLQHENPCGGSEYIEPFEGNADEDYSAYEEWFERNGLARDKFFDKLSDSFSKLDKAYVDTFKCRSLYFGTSREVLEKLYDNFIEADEFKDFVLCQYGDYFFVNVLGEWDDFSEAENIGYFYEEEFAEWIKTLTESLDRVEEMFDPNDVFNNTMIDMDEFCELVISYFDYKENSGTAEANALEVLDDYL